MTTKSKLLLGVVVTLAFIVVTVAGLQLGRQDTALPTAQSVARVQPQVQTAPRSIDPSEADEQPTSARTTANGFPLFSPAEVNTLRTQPDVLVIDVRGDPFWASEHVPGAISFPEDQAEQRYDELPRDKLIIAY